MHTHATHPLENTLGKAVHVKNTKKIIIKVAHTKTLLNIVSSNDDKSKRHVIPKKAFDNTHINLNVNLR